MGWLSQQNTCYQTQQPEFNLQGLHGRRKQIPTHCLLPSTHRPNTHKALGLCNQNTQVQIQFLGLERWLSTCYSCRGGGCSSQNPLGGSQSSITPVPKESDALFRLPQAAGTHAVYMHMCRQNTYTQRIKYINLKTV